MAKGLTITTNEVAYIIVIALIVLTILFVFYFLFGRFAKGGACLARFTSEVGKLLNTAVNTRGTDFVYTSFRIEDCVKDVYYDDANNRRICYLYVETEELKEECVSTIYAGVKVKFENNCGTSTTKLQPGYYFVKITSGNVDCNQ